MEYLKTLFEQHTVIAIIFILILFLYFYQKQRNKKLISNSHHDSFFDYLYFFFINIPREFLLKLGNNYGCINGNFLMKKWNRNLIPGPYCIPFIGYLSFFFTKVPHEVLAKLTSKYGNIIGFYLGYRYTVVLNNTASIREVLNKEALLARPDVPLITLFEKNSILNSSGKFFKNERLFALRIFRTLGYGKRELEINIQDEVLHFLSTIKSYEGKEFDIRHYLSLSINNNICILLFGKKFEYDDPSALKLKEGIKLFEKYNSQIDASVFFPFLNYVRYLYGINLNEKFQLWSNILGEVIRKEIEEHKQTLDKNNIRDYLDGYLLEIKKDPENNIFSENTLNGTAKAFFIGGSMTTQATIEWFLLAMATYPHIQLRAQQEIEENIGRNNMVQWSDLVKLHYMRSIMMETYRWRTLVPLNLIRGSVENTRISNGYLIPKDSLVLANLWAVHNDPNYWTKPQEFYPEHFLNESGKFINNENCIPFSIGKRSCPGENLAHMEFLLYATTLLQKYNICPPITEKLDLSENTHLTNIPKPFKIILQPRN